MDPQSGAPADLRDIVFLGKELERSLLRLSFPKKLPHGESSVPTEVPSTSSHGCKREGWGNREGIQHSRILSVSKHTRFGLARLLSDWIMERSIVGGSYSGKSILESLKPRFPAQIQSCGVLSMLYVI
ncbi:hypothetical protein BS47DRAFT_1205657 [Hydnum rufescens UP504]|uniref:Uncharacterized protein n=1 Tax=Hydnum rufescens UP504 TaxID=1448309 RepID=A0A9P6DQE5_9AGAM|nr:hypothetical protein BS47DRAFT_1205657 [Hydnum rufescens UP504]